MAVEIRGIEGEGKDDAGEFGKRRKARGLKKAEKKREEGGRQAVGGRA